MDQDLFTRALTPGHSSLVLLHEMSGEARKDVVETLAACLVRTDALALADYLAGEPLTKAKEAAADPMAAVEEAKRALAKEQQSLAGTLAAFWQNTRRGDPDDHEREPDRDTREVQALKTAMYAAEAAARPFTQAIRILEEQINGLRTDAPTPDPAVLATLAAALGSGYDRKGGTT